MFRKKRTSVETRAEEVSRLYRDLEKEIGRFKKRTGLDCAPGCGHCCENENVTATVLEFLPLAVELWKKGEAKKWLERLDSAGSSRVCVFYGPFGVGEGRGRCLIYPKRALICRLFGFSCVKDKNGASRFAACSALKKAVPEKISKIQTAIDAGDKALCMTHYSTRLTGIDPELSREYFSVNEAAKAALEKAGMVLCIKNARPKKEKNA